MSGQIWWYATRAAGLMTWATAMASIVLGLCMSSKLLGRKPGFPWLLDLHRYLSGLSVAFLGLHLVTLWADSYVEFTVIDMTVPFASEWKPLPVAWGVVAMWLMLGIEGSSLIKDHIPKKWWHGIHLSSYGVAVMGTIHAVQAGSDTGNLIIQIVGAMTLMLVLGLTVMRVVLVRSEMSAPKPRRRTRDLDAVREAAQSQGPRLSLAERHAAAVAQQRDPADQLH